MSSDLRRSTSDRAGRSARRRFPLRAEGLESRLLLTASAVNPVLAPAIGQVSWLGTASPSATPATPSGYSPQAISQAYGFNQITLQNGATKGDGTGQTIAIVDAYNDPNIAKDLAAFDAQYNLPTGSLSIYDQNGGTNLPAADAGWAQEIALDVEWAHAMAPGAKIDLIEASSATVSDLMTAVATAAGKASVVSMSWGGAEFAGQTAYDSVFSTKGVTFVASSGDGGGYDPSSGFGPSWPSSNPNVLSVGGTTLTTNPTTGAVSRETAWSGYFDGGSGGGVSSVYALPSYQATNLGSNLASGRVTPDVSYNANPNTGYAFLDTYGAGGQSGWGDVGGTSAGAPQWAALVAITDQGRALVKAGPLNSVDTLNTLYGLASTELKSTPSPYFHDVTSGFNAWGFARKGYDIVTGLGSPVANALVNYAVGSVTTPANLVAATTLTSTVTVTTPTPRPSDVVVISPASSTPTNPTTGLPFTVIIVPPVLKPLIPFTTAPVANTSAVAVSPFVTISPALPPQSLLTVPSPISYSSSETLPPSYTDPAPAPGDGESYPLPGPGDWPGVPLPMPTYDQPAEILASRIWDPAPGAFVPASHDIVSSARLAVAPAAEFDRPGGRSRLESMLAAGAAFAVWGTWEFRSRPDASRHRWTDWTRF